MCKIKELNDYQKAALNYAFYPSQFKMIYPCIGLAGETGEVSEKIKKIIRDDNSQVTPEKAVGIAKELGDVLWYVATLAHDIGYELGDIATMNIDKLESRKQRNVLGGSGDNR